VAFVSGSAAKDKEIIETRLLGNDKAIELVREEAHQIPVLIRAEVSQLKELHNEKFDSVQRQFSERDVRTEQTSKDNKVAIDAALQAQKEAVAKSEVGFTKQIDGITSLLTSIQKATDDKFSDMRTLINTMQKALDEKIDDVKARQGLTEGRDKGFATSYGMMIGLGGLAVTVGLLAVGIIGLYLRTQ